MKVELFRRITIAGRRWYFRVRARNGKIIVQSEGYRNRTDAVQTINLLKAGLPMARLFERP
jgi:uncharacterized protein YegP (UPF0339 family)